jgi:hypothetical protein
VAAVEVVVDEEAVEVALDAGSRHQVVRPVIRKYSSKSVRFIRSTKPLVRGERILVVRYSLDAEEQRSSKSSSL